MARYKFMCRSCKFECIGSIGREVGPHSSKVSMVCKSCLSIDIYKVAHPGSVDAEITMQPICTNCHSSNQLVDWDGLTCPHCNMSMRALGGDLDAERSRFKYW